MIPKDFITEWRDRAPWVLDRQVEQDLVISRALVELFSREPIAHALAFRGGTALYKLQVASRWFTGTTDPDATLQGFLDALATPSHA